MTNTNSRDQPHGMRIWIGYLLSALPLLFMLASSVMKLSHAPMVIEGFAKSGMSAGGRAASAVQLGL
jgi:hypothetical protein